MKETELIRLQVSRTVTVLEANITRYYDALYELRRLSLTLFTVNRADQSKIEDWFEHEGFDVDPDGFWLSLPLLELFRSGKVPENAISYSWHPQLRDNEDTRFRMYCLRNIGAFLREIHSRLPGIAWIYYQDVTNTSIQFPYIDQSTAITPDFDWSTYHTYVSVEPAVNPDRGIRWTPPTIDYAGEGLILSVSVPVYQGDIFIGLWSIDIPTSDLYQNHIQETYVAGQENFIFNHEGRIIVHPSIEAKIDKEKGSFYQEKIQTLGGDFEILDPMMLIDEKYGELQLKGDDGQDLLTYYGAVHHINWIFFVSVPRSCMLDAVNRRIRAAFDKIREGDLSYRIEQHQTVGNGDLLIEGYNEMASALQQQEEIRLQAEKALRESEEKYRLLFKNANDAIFIAQDESIVFANPKTLEITGYTKEELTALSLIKIVHPEYRNQVLDHHQRRLRGEDPPFAYSFKILNKAGDILWIQLNTVSISWNGKPATLNFARDITQQKELEGQLQHAQKMEAIGTLAGGIAHDFNNILFAIIGYTELASDQLGADTEAKEDLLEVLEACERAKNLILQILTFSKQEEMPLAPIHIGPIIEEALKLLRASLPATIEIRQHIKAEKAVAEADATKIHQVLMNLCTNSLHAMHEKGGVLSVTLDTVDLQSDRVESYNNLVPGLYIRIEVKDTGYGMDRRTMARIFEPYFSTKEQSEGTGLGLAVVHGIVKSYGGDITVDSESGQGTTFNVYLPHIMADIHRKKSSAALSPPTGHEHILYIDDENSIVKVGKRMLESLGYQVTTRTSSVESLELFRSNPDRFDMVITDLTMPNMTGIELSQEFLRIRPSIPIILCTGFSARYSEETIQEMGIKAYINKPLLMQDLAVSIRNLLDGK